MQERIVRGDTVSWKRSFDDVRTSGYCIEVIPGFVVVVSEHGVRHALRHRDATKEGG